MNKMYEDVYAAITECNVVLVLEKPKYFTVDSKVDNTYSEILVSHAPT